MLAEPETVQNTKKGVVLPWSCPPPPPMLLDCLLWLFFKIYIISWLLACFPVKMVTVTDCNVSCIILIMVRL